MSAPVSDWSIMASTGKTVASGCSIRDSGWSTTVNGWSTTGQVVGALVAAPLTSVRMQAVRRTVVGVDVAGNSDCLKVTSHVGRQGCPDGLFGLCPVNSARAVKEEETSYSGGEDEERFRHVLHLQ